MYATGNLRVENNSVHHYATWKRSYQPGIFWGGVRGLPVEDRVATPATEPSPAFLSSFLQVGNTFRGNIVAFGPHNGFLGGGDFADGVNNLFERNHVADCTFDTIDSGGFYTCGQRG
jgi:hypothetical protein